MAFHARSGPNVSGGRGSLPDPLPLIGRRNETRVLRGHLREQEPFGRPLVFLVGEGGAGKTRLAETLAEEAGRRGWAVVRGAAYPAESGIPYAVFSDAFLPLLRGVERERLASLTRGTGPELRYLFPALDVEGDPVAPGVAGDPEEYRIRLFWIFTEFLGRLASRAPLLVVLEDLHGADASSLELLHFAVRNVGARPVRFVCSYTEDLRGESPGLQRAEESLVSTGAAGVLRVPPLDEDETLRLLVEAFQVREDVCREFGARLHRWTGGNPFFVTETLKALVETGSLHERDGTWLGWESDERELARSVRELVAGRLLRVSEAARTVVEHAAVAGDRVPYQLLEALVPLEERALLGALDELRTGGILDERAEETAVTYRFTHPLFRECVYSDLGIASVRRLHLHVAETLEAEAGARAAERAEELAYHYVRSGSRALADKAARYLALAGRRSLARHADEEATRYLETALDLLEENGADAERVAGAREGVDRRAVVRELARALQRRGSYERAIGLLEGLLDTGGAAGDPEEAARIHRRLGLASFWSGRYRDALDHLEAGLSGTAADPGLAGRMHLARALCLQELGSWEEAREEAETCLETGEAESDAALRAGAHRILALLHTWAGPPSRAVEHARHALEIARVTGDREVEFWGYWTLAVVEGLRGAVRSAEEWIQEARRVARELHSPIFRLWIDEIAIEHANVTGSWDAAVGLGERSVALARSLEQRTLLPRLLVWTALLYFGRGDLERGRALVDEAWELAVGGRGGEGGELDVHTAVPAHIGRVAYHVAAEEYDEAIRIGEEGLALADSSGYVIWAIHHLLPLLAEACLLSRDLEKAEEIGERLARDAERMDHALGRAWAEACRALVTWLRGDVEEGAVLLERAAERLEEIPVVYDAARLRRQLAGRFADLGQEDAALRELRNAHEIFLSLGARRELDKARGQFREMGARPPSMSVVPGAGSLTGRELEVAWLVADGLSNKAIGKALGIAHRTVSTHLSKMYKKLGIGSRHELADLVKEGRLPRT